MKQKIFNFLINNQSDLHFINFLLLTCKLEKDEIQISPVYIHTMDFDIDTINMSHISFRNKLSSTELFQHDCKFLFWIKSSLFPFTIWKRYLSCIINLITTRIALLMLGYLFIESENFKYFAREYFS